MLIRLKAHPNLMKKLNTTINLDSLPKENIFRVPNHYFDELEQSILLQKEQPNLGELTSECLNNVSKTSVFNVPNGYFEQLASSIQNRIDEIQHLPISETTKTASFEVPDGYFDTLPSKIQVRIQQESKPTRVIQVSWNARRTWLTAAAACLVGMMIWFTLPTRQESLGEETLSQVTNKEIISYLNQQNLSEVDLAVDVTDKTKKQQVVEADSLLFQHLDVSAEDIIQHLDPKEIEDII